MATAILNGEYATRKFGPAGVRAERVTLTPKMAEKLLSANTKNRNIIKSYLKNMEQVMLRGEWAFNGEPIIIADTGRVMDGQHRLWACVNTGVSIDTIIVYGVDESVFPTIDRGVSRTVGNVLSIDGEEHYNSIAAALKIFHGFCKTGGQIYDGGGWSGGFSACVARELLQKHPGMRASVKVAMRCNHFKSKSLLAGLHYILSISHAPLANELIEVLESGGGVDRPFLVLREHIIYARVNRVPMGNRSLSAKTIRCFNAEVTGEWIHKVQWSPKQQFPHVVGVDYEMLESLL